MLKIFSRKILAAFGLFLFLLSFWGCSGGPQAVRSTSAQPISKQVLDGIEWRNTVIESYATRGEIIIRVRGTEYRGRHTVAAIPPNFFFVQISTPSNQPILTISGNENVVTKIDFRTGLYSRSELRDGEFNLTDTVWLTTDFFTYFPVGNVPMVANPTIREIKRPRDNETEFIINERGISQNIHYLTTTLEPPYLVKDVELKTLDYLDYSARFRQYQLFEDIYIPLSVYIHIPGKNVEVSFRNEQFMLNPPLTPEQFDVKPPSYFREEKELK